MRERERERERGEREREQLSTSVKLADDSGCQDTITPKLRWQITEVIPKATCGIGKRRGGSFGKTRSFQWILYERGKQPPAGLRLKF